MKYFCLLILVSVFITSCKNNAENVSSKTEISASKFEKLEQLNWLLGTWVNTSGDEFSQETWTKETENAFTAFSFTQVNNQTVFSETMALEQKGDALLLTVATDSEKKERPVSFTMISSEKGKVTFENKDHDFPQRITYSNPQKDSLHAWIEGSVEGNSKKVDFYFTKKDN